MVNVRRTILLLLVSILMATTVLSASVIAENRNLRWENQALKGGNKILQNDVNELRQHELDLIDRLETLQHKYDDLSKRAIIIPQQQSSASRGGDNATPRSYKMEATAYDPDIACTGKTNGITALGVHGRSNHTIAAPSYIPLGTVVYIPQLAGGPNHGIFVVEDRGGGIKGNKLDIYMDTHKQALKFGRQKVDMYIIQ